MSDRYELETERQLAQAQAEIEAVIQLGDDFGFQFKPFSVGQVITHAKYLQNERARLLFENTEIKREIAALRSQLAEALELIEYNYQFSIMPTETVVQFDQYRNWIKRQMSWLAANREGK